MSARFGKYIADLYLKISRKIGSRQSGSVIEQLAHFVPGTFCAQAYSVLQADEQPSVEACAALQADEQPSIEAYAALQADEQPSIEAYAALQADEQRSVEAYAALQANEQPSVEACAVLQADEQPSVEVYAVLEAYESLPKESAAGPDNNIPSLDGGGIISVSSGNVDIVTIKPTLQSAFLIQTNEGNDILKVESGNSHVLEGGTGNDRYIIKNLKQGAFYELNQTSAGTTDRDVLELNDYSSNEFFVQTKGESTLFLQHKETEAIIKIADWYNNPLKYINFKDTKASVKEIAQAKGYAAYKLKLAGSYEFQGETKITANNVSLTNVSPSDRLSLSGNNNMITVKGGSFALDSGENNTFTSLGNNTKLIINDGEENIILALGATTLEIYGGNGNYVQLSDEADQVLLDNVQGENWYINAGAGDDSLILNSGFVNHLQGGLGTDTYRLKNLARDRVYVIDQSLPDDGMADSGKDKLYLDNSMSSNFMVSKNAAGDLLLHNEALNTVVQIKDWAQNPLDAVTFSDGTINKDILNLISGPVNLEVSQQQVIKDFIAVLDVSKDGVLNSLNRAVAISSRGLFTSMEDLINRFKSLCLSYGSSDYNRRKEFLLNYCGIDLDNADTGSITGADAGGPVEKNAENVVPEKPGLTMADLVYEQEEKALAYNFWGMGNKNFSAKKVVCNGQELLFYWDDKQLDSLEERGLIANRSVAELMIAGICESWGEASLELIEESLGISLTDQGSDLAKNPDGIREIMLNLEYVSPTVTSPRFNDFGWTASTSISNNNFVSVGMPVGTKICLSFNMFYFQNGITDISGLSAKGNLSSGYLDRILAHELTHATMAANINSFRYLPTFVVEGLADLVIGADDDRSYEMLSLPNTNFIVTFGDGRYYNQQELLDSVYALDNTNYLMSSYAYGAGVALFRYMAKQVADYTAALSTQGLGAEFSLDQLINTELDFENNQQVGGIGQENQGWEITLPYAIAHDPAEVGRKAEL